MNCFPEWLVEFLFVFPFSFIILFFERVFHSICDNNTFGPF